MEYRHKQTGYLFFVLVWMAFVFGFVLVMSEADETEAALAAGAFSLVIALVVLWFNSLLVVVDAERVKVSFGPGRPHRTMATRDVTGFRQVRNKWYYGLGTRRLSEGWMYNVWGLDAVELDLADGQKFRIGTDEPSDLLAALSAHTVLRAE